MAKKKEDKKKPKDEEECQHGVKGGAPPTLFDRIRALVLKCEYVVDRMDSFVRADNSFSPPGAVRRAAALGLELRGKFNRGGTPVGVARARDLSNGRAVSVSTLKRMRSYFQRHAVDAKAKGSDSTGYWARMGNPSAGWIAWLLWGGDPGKNWAERMLKQSGEIE